MKMERITAARRPVAAVLTAVMCMGLAVPAFAEDAIQPACDETYYATLDYYGKLTDSSMVKTYRTYGNPVLTDYGSYDSVTNLTDRRAAKIETGKVTFDLTGDVPDKFYFEGKTARPYREFPWKLDLSYRLNGVPTKAEELAGKSGTVEIILHAVPNEKASEYSRNNLVLTAVSAFNGDDILSLEAPGAQVQLLGNLYCVMNMVLPGEERECVIRVGTEDFSYGGMVFLAVPATLEQLSQIGELREAEEEIESSYRTIADSMDVILASLEGMGGSLNATANGLDQLNAGRAVISQGKDAVYTDLDAALAAAGPLSEAMKPAAEHVKNAQSAVSDAVVLVNELDANVPYLRTTLSQTRDTLSTLKSQISGTNNKASVKSLIQDLGGQLKALQDMNTQFQSQKEQLSKLGVKEDGKTLTVNGMTVAEVKAAMEQLRQVQTGYQDLPEQLRQAVTLEEFLALNLAYRNDGQLQTVFPGQAGLQSLIQSYAEMKLSGNTLTDAGHLAAAQAVQTALPSAKALLAQASDPTLPEQLAQMEQLQQMLDAYDITLQQLVDTAGEYAGLMALLEPVSADLQTLCRTLSGENGVLANTGKLSDRADEALWCADRALETLDELDDLLNQYEPKAQKALKDAQTLAESAATGLTALVDAARTGESLLKQSGPALDAGTKQSLDGLSASLRSASTGLNQTANIRRALNNIDAVVTDQWNGVAGEERNLLQMDPTAPAQSITDPRNEGTASIQYVMRSQEIKQSQEAPQDTETNTQTDTGTFWERVKAMFRDLWDGLTGIF